MLRRRDTETLEELYGKSNIRPFKLLYLECLAVEALIRNPVSTAQLVSEDVPSHSYDTRNTYNINRPLTRLRRTDKLHHYRYLTLLSDHKRELEKIDELPTYRRKNRAVKEFITPHTYQLMTEFPM